MQIRLSNEQFEFVTAEEQFPGFVGGFGSGKTFAGVSRSLAKKLQYPGQNVGYYLPTYDLVTTVAFPRFEEQLDEMKVRHRINKNDKIIDLGPFGQVIMRTMDTPERIIGFEVADSVVDELDTLPREKARDAWVKIIARNRQKKPDGSLNTVGVVTTPEGFRFVYHRWKRDPAPGYRLIKAPTQSNAKHLPAGYIQSLKDSYPENLLAAYLDGEFVNLTSGTVYTGYDRHKNASTEVIREGDALNVGMDFNVGKMALVIFVEREGKPHAVKEHTDGLDTPEMIDLLHTTYGGHKITVFPDASGKNRKSNKASASDIALLKEAGFRVNVNPSNPAVRDRVLAMNYMLESRDLRVNTDQCPMLADALEQQAYNAHGEPDKSSGFDHVNDGAGYYIAYRFPIVKRVAFTKEIRGLV